MRQTLRILCAAAVMVLALSHESSAQQSLNLYLGGFVPRAEDARSKTGNASDDVLVSDLGYLSFRIADFNGATAGGEWLFGMGPHFEGGLGLGVYQRTVPTVYLDYVNRNGSEIEQALKLRVVPFTATIRYSPLGTDSPFQPYVGGGVGIFGWRYSESGQFVDFNTGDVFRQSYVGSGAAAGPVALGGVRLQPGPIGVGFEVRYQHAVGTLPRDQGFASPSDKITPRIDLGGFNYLATFTIKF
jgi:hypothetical protein